MTKHNPLSREQAQDLSGPELAEALNRGDLSREIAKDLFTVDKVAIVPGPTRRCRYSVRVFGWGRWWMPSLPPNAQAAWTEAQAIAQEYGAPITFHEDIDQTAFRQAAGID